MVKQAGDIVHRDIKKSRLKGGRRRAISSELETDISDALEHLRETFPPSFFTLLAYCSGKKHLVSGEATGDGEDLMEEEHDVTSGMGGPNIDAVMVYFWGTAIARAVLGSRYFPPHFLKLSQVFKVSTTLATGGYAKACTSKYNMALEGSRLN